MPNSRSFQYTIFKNASGQVFYRPLIPIQLLGKTNMIQREALVDSGADVSVLPYQLGLDLGFKWERQNKLTSLSGAFAIHESRAVIIDVKLADFPPQQLIFAWSSVSNVRLILGQTNFFNRFNITFRLFEGMFDLTPAVIL